MSSTPHIGADRPGLHPDLSEAARAIHQQFDESHGEHEVNRVLDTVAGQFAEAPIRAFVPLFVQRYSKEELTRLEGTHGSIPDDVSRSA